MTAPCREGGGCRRAREAKGAGGVGSDGIMLFFVLMALAMSVSRELGVMVKAHRLSPRSATRSASILSNNNAGSDTDNGNRPNTSNVTWP